MKAPLMATEPVTGGIAAGVLVKAGLAGLIGLLGGAIMAAFDPPQSRKELFLQGAVAGTGSLIFGGAVAALAVKYITVIPPSELTLPAYFVTGALSWGVFGALAKLRGLLGERIVNFCADKLGLKK